MTRRCTRLSLVAAALLAATSLTAPPAIAVEPDAPDRQLNFDESIGIAAQTRLSDQANIATGADKGDMTAAAAIYDKRSRQPLWVTQTGFSKRAEALIAEIRKADDFGLKASNFALPELPTPTETGVKLSTEQLAEAEAKLSIAALKYARHARGGRIPDPSVLSKYLDRDPRPFEPESLIEELAGASDAAAYLRGLHPRHPQFEKLRQLYLAARRGGGGEGAVPADGARIKPGERHADIALVRRRLGIEAGEEPTLYDEELAAAVTEFQKSRRINPANGEITTHTRRALATVATGGTRKLLANMEQWRWMPDNLGDFHVQANVPEFMFYVYHKGKVVHTERIVAGKVDTQTPIFSADMDHIVFHPSWGVPNSIKANEILPSLARAGGGGFWGGGGGASAVLERHGLRVQLGGREINPDSINWSNVDVRNFHFYQPPGARNVLGVVKFMFPNKHDVYMHDTTSKSLFAQSVRTYSHGCMRVQNPHRFAEVLLRQDRGWGAANVSAAIASGSLNNRINLNAKIPVHVTYFTAFVDEAGKPQYRADIYGHEERIAMALEGRAAVVAQRAKQDRTPIRAQPVAQLNEVYKPSINSSEAFRRAFNNN